MGIEAFVEGLGLPLTWGMAVLDVLLLLFSVFFCKSNLHGFPYTIFKHVFALVIRFLCTFLCTSYALFVHFFCTFYVFLFHFLCAFCAPLKSAQKVYTLFLKRVCTFYALLKAQKKEHKKCMRILTKINKK